MRNLDKPCWVYVLRDPLFDNVVRYIGIARDPVARLKWHVRAGTDVRCYAPAYCWINSILVAGHKPVMEIVSDEVTKRDALVIETELIKLFGRVGHKLAQTSQVPWGLRHFVENKGRLFHNTVLQFFDGSKCYYRPNIRFMHSLVADVSFMFTEKNIAKSMDGRFVIEVR